MSTSILNGFIANFSNSSKVNQLNDTLENIIRLIQRNFLTKSIAEKSISYYDDFIPQQTKNLESFSEDSTSIYNFVKDYEEGNGFNFFLKKNGNFKRSVLFSLCDVYSLAATNNIRNEYNINVNLFFKSIGNKTLYYIIAPNEIVNEFRKTVIDKQLLEDYHYYDNSDEPDNISRAKWKARGKTWDKIFNTKYSFYDSMYVKHINYVFYLNTETLVDEVIAHIPEDTVRYLNLYKKLKTEEFYITPENTTSGDLSAFMKAHRIASNKTKELLSNSKLPEDYNKYTDFFINKNDLINKIKTVKIKFN